MSSLGAGVALIISSLLLHSTFLTSFFCVSVLSCPFECIRANIVCQIVWHLNSSPSCWFTSHSTVNNFMEKAVVSLWMGGVAVPKIQAPPHICYHNKYGSSASKGMCINRSEPQKLGCAWASPLPFPSLPFLLTNLFVPSCF